MLLIADIDGALLCEIGVILSFWGVVGVVLEEVMSGGGLWLDELFFLRVCKCLLGVDVVVEDECHDDVDGIAAMMLNVFLKTLSR